MDIGGELDIATAEPAVSYVRQVIDRHRRPVIVDLTALRFCDAKGLNGLLRLAGNAEQTGCPFRLASPRPSLVKIMRITGLDHKFLAPGSRRFLRTHPPIPAARAVTSRPLTQLAQAMRQPALWTWLSTRRVALSASGR